MPDSKLPDISLQILFSMSRPHIFWYSWKTKTNNKHRWASEARCWIWRWKKNRNLMFKWQTCTEVGLAASTQDGIKLRLVSSHFVFPSGVQFLLPIQTCQNGKKNVTRQANDCLLLFEHPTNVPERPAGPGRCQQSLFHHDFPKQGQMHTQCSFSSQQIKHVCNEIIG